MELMSTALLGAARCIAYHGQPMNWCQRVGVVENFSGSYGRPYDGAGRTMLYFGTAGATLNAAAQSEDAPYRILFVP